MSVLRDSEIGHGTQQRGASECKPLLHAATKELYRNNSFRITGLQVDATSREIAKQADKLKLMEELGQGATIHTGIFALKPPPVLHVIREAIQRLRDPEQRIIDEFFWFWPQEFGEGKQDVALQALANGDLDTALQVWSAREQDSADGVTAGHNLAIAYHLIALDWEQYAADRKIDAKQREEIAGYWKSAFKRWDRLASKDQLWDSLTLRIRQLADARLTTGFVRRMRATLPEALDKINAELALAYAEAGNFDLARLHVQLMRETNLGFDNMEKTAELVLAPVKSRLRQQIERAKNRAEKSPADAPKTAKELLDQAQNSLSLFDLFFGKDSEIRNDLFDEVATVCNRVAVAYQKSTGDDGTSLAILRSVLPLATSIDIREQIQENIATVSGNIRDKELGGIYALLKSIQESEATPDSRLKRFEREAGSAIMKVSNISGVSASFGPLAGDSRVSAELFDSAAIVLRGISLDAWNTHHDLATASRAIELALNYARDQELKTRLLGDKTTLEQMASASQRAMTPKSSSNRTALGWLIFVGVIIVLSALGNCNSSTSNSSSSTPESSLPYTPPSSSYGNTYRAPDTELEREGQTIEAERSNLEMLKREIEAARPLVDENSQVSIDQFNAKIDRYETSRQAFNLRVAAYNEKLHRSGQ